MHVDYIRLTIVRGFSSMIQKDGPSDGPTIAKPRGGASEPERAVLNAQETADFLRVTTRTLRRLTSAGLVPRPARVGHRIVWARSHLLAFIEQGGSTALKKKQGGRPRRAPDDRGV